MGKLYSIPAYGIAAARRQQFDSIYSSSSKSSLLLLITKETMDNDKLRKKIDQDTATFKAEMLAGSWWHSIDLGDGLVTKGVHTPEELKENYRRLNLPEDLSGKR